ncbi:CDP-glycerol glycerophosphotransferase family protein [Halocynthiibacter sp. C4]|uniref:bifunctional glycosyltransferase/CDP-glycerol:glycerophosphate glycerophosphotransferase n=1 Tax=Halocynthiibacter sp. C4 TaxID=2992758 RepID=UPI00237AB588|nr:CDP-glycerol glycerophosphotransferase family protein [Halocynthiibacter sp. C4]MDE0588566.1 CDP-glycerol glycerophosphotransferase family protein [Halocynthiibacter sp. C4]
MTQNPTIENNGVSRFPLVSVIIPIYKVAPFVRKCLQSVAGQTYGNIETIIVNDASPDESMVAVERSLGGVPQPNIINLTENGGLGNARNIGMKAAQGKYIFFLDSDDWLDPTTIEKAVAKAEIGQSQVVVVDFCRWEFGKTSQAKNREPYRSAKFDFIDPREDQSVLMLFNLAQTKLYQKAFLTENDFSFRCGVIYEDVDWTFRVMTTATRVSIVDEPLYYYRIARPGSILASKGDKHFDVIRQYQRVFEYLRENNKQEFFDTTYSYALHAIYSVLAISRRIRNSRRKAFFYEAQLMLREACGVHEPKLGMRRSKRYDRILRKGSYFSFRLRKSKFIRKIVVKLEGTSKQIKEKVTILHSKHPLIFDKLVHPVPRGDVVFESYWGTQFSDSPKYIYEYIQKHHPDIKCVYALNRDVDAALPASDRVRRNSYDHRVAMLAAKVWINNNNYIFAKKKSSKQKFIQTFHGIPLKKVGIDLCGKSADQDTDYAALAERCALWDDVITAGAHHTETLRAAFQTKAAFHEVGSPRTDCLQDKQFQHEWRLKIRDEFDLAPSCKIVLYAPTWRAGSTDAYLSKTQLNRICDAVNEDAIVLYRGHHMAQKISRSDHKIIDATDYPDSQHLCAAADMLITDYSSIAFDFATTGRPALFYTPDYNEYEKQRGLYVNMPEEVADVTHSDFDGLLAASVKCLREPNYATKMNRIIVDKFLEAERPNSCNYVVQQLILPHLRRTKALES